MDKISLNNEKIRIWPDDWDIHILNTFDLYFDSSNDYNIEYLRGTSTFTYLKSKDISDCTYKDMRQNIIISSVQLETILMRKNKFYNVCFRYRGDGNALGIIMGITGVIEDISGDATLMLTNPIDACIGSSAYDCAKKVEKIIYNDRDDGNDGDNGIPEPDPVTDLYSCPSI